MAEVSRGYLWGGRVLTALPVVAFLGSAAMKLSANPDFLKQWAAFGFKPEQATAIGAVELLCAILYAIPQTSGLGAVLLTGYLGGATVTHVRVGEPFIAPIVLGVFVWGGLWFRDERVRHLLPIRK